MTGFCNAEVNPLGPLQLYVAPLELAVSEISLPRHAGELLPATGAAGVGFTITAIVSVAMGGQPATDAVREYVPDPETGIPAIVGFCKVEVKLLGPPHA